jgi:hypothetical protein
VGSASLRRNRRPRSMSGASSQQQEVEHDLSWPAAKLCHHHVNSASALAAGGRQVSKTEMSQQRDEQRPPSVARVTAFWSVASGYRRPSGWRDVHATARAGSGRSRLTEPGKLGRDGLCLAGVRQDSTRRRATRRGVSRLARRKLKHGSELRAVLCERGIGLGR